MDKLKKVVLTSAFIGFSTLAIYNSFADKEELNLNSASVNDKYFGESSLKSTYDFPLKDFLKQDLSEEEVLDALESISYFKKLAQKDNYSSGDLNKINNNFLDHIEKYVDENKMEEFKKVIYKKLEFSKDLYNSGKNKIEKDDYLEKKDSIDDEYGDDKKDYSKEYKSIEKIDLPKIKNIPNLETKTELVTKSKKELLEKYSKLINTIPEEKLPIILKKIDLKITQINNSSLAQEKKEKSLILLTALSEIINERMESSISDISIEELLK